MRWWMLAVVAVGCAHQAKTATPVSDQGRQACVDDLDKALDKARANDLDGAFTLMEADYKRCGPGFQILGFQALIHEQKGRYSEAARLASQEYSEPNPAPQTLGVLIRVLPKLPEAERQAVLNMGSTPATAIVVPEIAGEYIWIAHVVCGDPLDAPVQRPIQQSLVSGPHGMLDSMSFDCGGKQQTLYFDYASDPMEQEYIKESQPQK